MAGFAIVVVVLVLWVIIKAAGSSSGATSTGGYNRLAARGISGRGILLAVSNISSGSVGTGLYKMQQRAVTIDIELPDQPPYQATVTALIPLNLVRDVLPGATVEVRVDRSDPNNIAIVGPGVGFNSSTLMTQGQSNQGAA
jgi:hypothetical protein